MIKDSIKICNYNITQDSVPFIIAEAGINHNGKIENAFKMIEVAKQAGADCVKFQTFKAEEFVSDPNLMFSYKSQGKEVTEPMLDMFKRHQFSKEEWVKIKNKCDAEDIIFMSTAQNPSDLQDLLELNIPAIKVGSDDFTNIPLLKEYTQTGLPIIVSMGMSDMAEVFNTLSAMGTFEGYPTILLLCTSLYPTPATDVNLLKLKTLSNAFPKLIVGFSDHTQGALASSLAVALGAKVFEKHFTLSHDLEGPDHWFSEDPESLTTWIKSIKTAHTMLGASILKPTTKELDMRILSRRSVVAIADINPGETLTQKNIGLKRPGNGIPPIMFENILGKTATTKIEKDKLINYFNFK